ncbi:hypothetical protein NQ315_010487 [Exocentrus adspersus]|uniref:Photosystem I assembly protein Ycf4 n=1 Tax=Exocentrus adspersus TaxID=1586481 RepID=A0AAV8W5H4_9CUCU|nr:hypothetical protein NQ315_010487 [Exocentrus adspersus]
METVSEPSKDIVIQNGGEIEKKWFILLFGVYIRTLRYAFGGGDLLQVLIILLKHALLYYVFLIVIVIYNGVLLLRNYFQSLKIYLTNTIGLEGVDSPFSLYKPLDGHITLPIAVISDKTLFRLREASTISNILI